MEYCHATYLTAEMRLPTRKRSTFDECRLRTCPVGKNFIQMSRLANRQSTAAKTTSASSAWALFLFRDSINVFSYLHCYSVKIEANAYTIWS